MGEKTNILWTDHTFNPWMGCAKVHTGCKHCYAENMMDIRYGRVQWGEKGTRLKTSPSYWAKPLRWNKDAYTSADRDHRRVFCASLADVFEDIGSDFVFDHKGGTMYRNFGGPDAKASNDPADYYRIGLPELRIDLFKLIWQTSWLDWQLLTKRPENVPRMTPCRYMGSALNENAWLGTSVSDQATANKFLPELLKSRELFRFLFASYEPIVGPVDFTDFDFLDWVIIGGESGPDARHCELRWIEDALNQCLHMGIPVFVKQFGANCWHDGSRIVSASGKGENWDEWPSQFRVRQFPNSKG